MTPGSLSQGMSTRESWSAAMGALTATIGVFIIIYPLATVAVSTRLLGSALVLASLAQFIFAFTSRAAGELVLKLLLGVPYGAAGIFLAFIPPAASRTFAAGLGMMLVVEAILETVIAFALTAVRGRAWFVLSALGGLVLGLIILAEWPDLSDWTIGTLVGAAVSITGITRISGASRRHRPLRLVRRPARAAQDYCAPAPPLTAKRARRAPSAG